MSMHTTTTSNSIIEQAYEMALTTLKDRYTAGGIYAGKNQFSDIWIRDSCYAALGALSVGDVEVVKTNLETLLAYQNEDGQVPLRVGQKWFLLKYLGVDSKTPQARYTEDKGVSVPADGNSLFITIVERYIQATNDRAFLVRHFDRVKKAMEWNFAQDSNRDTLMEEGHYAGWADSLKKAGTVLYTNVLHFKAVKSFAILCHYIGREAEAKHYDYLADCVQSALNRTFWNGSYYIDWISPNGKRQEYFSTDGNVFAIVFGVADRAQSLKIQAYIKEHQLDQGFSTQTVHPPYKRSLVYSLFHFVNIHDYHNGLEWLWLGCVDAVSKSMLGMNAQAKQLLERIAQKIVDHGGVYEVYDGGNPVKRLFYKSEHWFAWSAGMFVWACHELGMVPK